MNLLVKIAVIATALPLQATANPSVWNSGASPALPYRYIESTPIVRVAPQNENAETYASNSLFLRLYPSIAVEDLPEVATNDTRIASITRESRQSQPRGILSSSYVQEIAYIDAYSNIRRYEEYFSFPSIRMSLTMPPFGTGFGGGYRPLQFGFGPAAFKFW